MTNPRSLLTEEQQFEIEERTAICMESDISEEEAKNIAYACYVHKWQPNMASYYPLK